MDIVAIIPARFGSTRLPGKPLSDINGKPMIQHVYEQVRRSPAVDRVLVATDDDRIAGAVRAFGGEAVLTSPDHATGTDRLAEAASGTAARIVVNVQGDEPMLDPRVIEGVVRPLLDDPGLPMSTVSVPLRDVAEMLSPAVVKVVVDGSGNALYFSRAAIPFVRDPSGQLEASARLAVERQLARRHLGVYAYQRAALLQFARLPLAPLEQAESLEQLRALHHGWRIRVVAMDVRPGVAVDTPEDLEATRILMRQQAG